MDILTETFNELNELGLVTHYTDFSTNYLNKSRHYLSMIRASEHKPSVDCLARLAANLKHKKDTYKDSRYADNRKTAVLLEPLTTKVWTEFYKRSLER